MFVLDYFLKICFKIFLNKKDKYLFLINKIKCLFCLNTVDTCGDIRSININSDSRHFIFSLLNNEF